jgi:hypothetical protein
MIEKYTLPKEKVAQIRQASRLQKDEQVQAAKVLFSS